jgi:hypothetical protein
LFNDAKIEVLWGLKNLMKSMVPDEKSDLTDEDRPQMCQGMKMVLDRHNIYVKPEMVRSSFPELEIKYFQLSAPCMLFHFLSLHLALGGPSITCHSYFSRCLVDKYN